MEEPKSDVKPVFKVSNQILFLVQQNQDFLELFYNAANLSQCKLLLKSCKRSTLDLLASLLQKINNNINIEYIENRKTIPQEDLDRLKKSIIENELLFKNFQPTKSGKQVRRIDGDSYVIKNYHAEKSDIQMKKIAIENCEMLHLTVRCLLPIVLEMSRERIRAREDRSKKPEMSSETNNNQNDLDTLASLI